MKNTLFFIALLFSLSLDAQDSKRYASKLDAVTVYEQGANFSRLADVTINPGSQTIVFYGLPINLKPESIQIGSSDPLEIVSIGIGNTPFEQREKPEDYLKIEKELEAIKSKKVLLDAEILSLQLEAEFLSKNTQLGGNQGFTLAELQQISAFAREQKKKNELAKQEAQKALSALHTKEAALRNELELLKQPLSMLSAEVIVKLNATKTHTVKFQLNYSIASNASWYSNYNLYFEELGDDLKLVHKAQIYQGTGEDWENVKLRLATGISSENINMPSLYPRYINFLYRESKSSKKSMVMRDINAEAGQADAVSSGYAFDDESFNANVSQTNQTNRMEYAPLKRYTLSNKSSENIVLRELSVGAQYEYQASPSLEPAAYLMAKWQDWEKHQLLAGEISIYNQGLYIGKVYSNFKESADSMYVSLGKDPQITVNRERIFNKESKSFLGGDRIQEFEYSISVVNRKNNALKIRIFDQIPISQNDAIKIKSELGDGAKLNAKTGIISWEFELASKAKKDLNFSYEIRHPKDQQINW